MATPTPNDHRFLIGLLLLAGLCVVSADPSTNQAPWQTLPTGQWNYAPSDYRHSTTENPPKSDYGSWPGMQPPGFGQQSHYTGKPPRIESELSMSRPYVQQGIILKLSLVSQNNLLTAQPQIAANNQLNLQLLEGPTTYSRTRQGQREIVNDYFYQVTPLRAGRLILPEIRFSGNEQVAGDTSNSRRFDVALAQPLSLEVREAHPASTPWLPLEQLALRVKLPNNHKAAAGKPLPVTVELTAIGMSGNQLPSLESQLNSDAFRVYRDHSRVTTSLNRSNHKLTGRRIEHFTLVPQYGGDLNLPPLSLNWWDTRSDTAQRTSVPMRPIAVSGSSRPSGFFSDATDSTPFPAGTSSAFWIPLAVAFGIIFGYWLAVWVAYRRKGRPGQSNPLQPLVAFLQRPMREIAPAFSPLKERLRTTGRILNPITRWQRWRRHLVGMLPLSVRFYFCVRFVDEENDPEIWGYTLRFLANKHLGLPINASYSAIGKHIIDFHPKAQPQTIRGLIHELEESIYGHHPLEFERWKAAFKHEIRPSLRLWPRRRIATKAALQTALPRLNPERLISG